LSSRPQEGPSALENFLFFPFLRQDPNEHEMLGIFHTAVTHRRARVLSDASACQVPVATTREPEAKRPGRTTSHAKTGNLRVPVSTASKSMFSSSGSIDWATVELSQTCVSGKDQDREA